MTNFQISDFLTEFTYHLNFMFKQFLDEDFYSLTVASMILLNFGKILMFTLIINKRAIICENLFNSSILIIVY